MQRNASILSGVNVKGKPICIYDLLSFRPVVFGAYRDKPFVFLSLASFLVLHLLFLEHFNSCKHIFWRRMKKALGFCFNYNYGSCLLKVLSRFKNGTSMCE